MSYGDPRGETLFEILEDIDPKLEALGIMEVNDTIKYATENERQH